MRDGERMDLGPVFYPDTIAVAGVSTTNIYNPGTVTFQRNLLLKGYTSDKVFGINPKGGSIEGVTLLPSFLDLPKPVDLAVLCVKATETVQAMKDAIDAKARGVVVISGGFSETGRDGKALQDQLARLAIDNRIPLIGPNCVGVYNPGWVNTFFIPQERFVLPKPNGNVAIVSQSGGVLADQWFTKFVDRNIAISKAVSLGNKAVIDEVDLMEHLQQDPATDVIGLYLEGFARGRGREFLIKSRLSTKTVLMFRGGKTERGSKAAASHTAAVASDERILDGALKQYSIINCNTEQEMITYAKAFSLFTGRDKPFITGKFSGNVVIVTVSGGHGVIASDFCKKYGLGLLDFTPGERDSLAAALSPAVASIASIENPIDLTGSCNDNDVINLLHTLMRTPRVDLVLLLILPYPPGLTMSLGSRVASVVRIHRKPVITYSPWLARYEMLTDALNEANIPIGNSIEEAVLMAHAVLLKSQADERASINRIITEKDVLIEDYHEFTRVLDEINTQRVKRLANTLK